VGARHEAGIAIDHPTGIVVELLGVLADAFANEAGDP